MFAKFGKAHFFMLGLFWEREKTNSTTITQWCTGRFYHLFAPRNNTLHHFCLINPKVLTKMAGIKNIIRYFPSMSHSPPPPQPYWLVLQKASNPPPSCDYSKIFPCINSFYSYVKGFISKLLFTYSQKILNKYWNGKQNLSPEKGICCYFMKFYHTIDTVIGVYWISRIISCISLVL